MYYRNKGVVLISVLMIVLLLSSVAVLIGNNYFVSFKRAQYQEFQNVSLNIFRNIESLALRKIDNELRFNTKVHANNNALFRNDFIFELNQGVVTGKISDASNCFNINAIVKKVKNDYKPNEINIEVFKRLMTFNEVDLNLVDEAIDQIIDWIDKDSNPRAYGLEDYYYSGPLNNPKEYTASRLFYSVAELKSLPAIKSIGWELFDNNFCALPDNSLVININTLKINDDQLFASMFKNMSYIDAQYILDNIPEEGFRDINDLKRAFPSYDFNSGNTHINFSSSNFLLLTTFTYENFYSESKSTIYYGPNNNSYIVSRIYNGI
jgi:general secretion pathway protein K